MKRAAGAALAATLAAAGYAAIAGGAEPAPATNAASDAPPAIAPAAAAQPATGSPVHRAPAATAPATTQPAPSRDLVLPDGTTVPTLNGAVDAEPLATYWGPFPWSPIVGVERNDQGLDWYRHADGSYSTTQMVWRQDLGRDAAMTRVAHPGAAPPTTATSR